jgi:hypothetical protein
MKTATSENLIESDTLLLNVAIVPSDDVAKSVGIVSKELRRFEGVFEIDGIDHFAHLTLYMARFAKSMVPEVRSAISSVVGSLGPIDLVQFGYLLTDSNYYEVSYRKSPAVVLAQSALTARLCDLRFSPGDPLYEDYFGEYSKAQRANAEQYGYDLAGGLFRPHITLTRFGNSVREKLLPTAGVDLSFRARRIGLFQADSLGAASRLMATFDINAHADV